LASRNSGPWNEGPAQPGVDRRVRRREAFFTAGLTLFGRDGFALTSVERLCVEAGATPRDFYQEFADTQSLLIAIHDRITTEAMHAMSTALADTSAEPLQTRITAAVTTYLGVTAADPARARVAYVEVLGIGPTIEQHRQAWRERFIDLFTAEVERAVTRGEAHSRDYRMTAMAVVGTVNELAYQWARRSDRPPADQIVGEVVRLIVAALNGRPHQPQADETN